jgi:peptide/nickel transport system ATP-binding protein
MSELLLLEGLWVKIPWQGLILHPVQDVGFTLGQGETLCLVGESGCGKSMTALSIMGLLPKKSIREVRKLILLGEDLSKATEKRMREIRGNLVGMVFQEPMTSLNPCLTIGTQLMETLRRHKNVTRREARERAVELLERVGIPAAGRRLSHYPHQLSGGLRQRVMIAMALMCKPAFIIADEPTTALDVTIQAQILALLKDLQGELGIGLLLITHDLGIVARMADKVAVMYAGQIVETGRTHELFAKPLHPYTEALMTCIPSVDRTPPGSRLGAIPGAVPTLTGPMNRCHFWNRCPKRSISCTQGPVPLVSLGESRSVRCILST